VSNAQENPMLRALTAILSIIFLTMLSSCSQSDKETAREREKQASEKVHTATDRLDQDARKLGHEIKDEARVLDHKLGTALNSPAPATSGTSRAEDKVVRGSQEFRVEAGQAGVKLDHAALIAKVKAKLASDVGLATVTGIEVDTSGQVVTLRGTVDSVQQKQMAEQAALQVSGVTKVIDALRVRQ
jgi:osmotically-inducible protein OsmY